MQRYKILRKNYKYYKRCYRTAFSAGFHKWNRHSISSEGNWSTKPPMDKSLSYIDIRYID